MVSHRFRKAFCLTLLLILTPTVHAQTLEMKEKLEGFRPVFNGTDFGGFRFSGGKGTEPPKNWTVADGMIKLSGGGSPHLATQWEYDDFDVRFQWKPLKKGYNSGFWIRTGRSVGAHQINLAQNAAGNLMSGAKGGVAVPKLQKEPGEWNEWRVLAVGDKITFWCNDQKAWEVTDFKVRRGYLGLQAEGAAIDFKNFRIREFGMAPVSFGDDSVTEPMVVKKGGITSSGKYADGVLRLEWKSASNGGGMLHWRGFDLNLTDARFAKALYPGVEWNYLEVKTEGNAATVWLNGMTFPKMFEKLSMDPGSIRVTAAGGALVAVQNVRFRKDEK